MTTSGEAVPDVAVGPVPSVQSVEEKAAAILATITDRHRSLAAEIIRLELERYLLEIRLQTSYRQLPAHTTPIQDRGYSTFAHCRVCSGKFSPEQNVIAQDKDGKKLNMWLPCSECGSMGLEQWKQRLGINDAVSALRNRA